MGRRRLDLLLRDARGATAVEYAFILPVLILMLMGTGYFGQMFYGRALLNGAVRQAARNATLEDADTTALDQSVVKVISPALPGVTVTASGAATSPVLRMVTV